MLASGARTPVVASELSDSPVNAAAIIDKDLPIHVSNVALFNPATKKADRSGIKVLEGGKKVRVFKDNGEQVDA